MKNYLLPVLLLTSFYAFETNAENKIPVEHFWCESAMTSGTLHLWKIFCCDGSSVWT